MNQIKGGMGSKGNLQVNVTHRVLETKKGVHKILEKSLERKNWMREMWGFWA